MGGTVSVRLPWAMGYFPWHGPASAKGSDGKVGGALAVPVAAMHRRMVQVGFPSAWFGQFCTAYRTGPSLGLQGCLGGL